MRGRTLALFLALTTFVPAVAFAQQTIIFVRHAERADGGAGTNTMSGAPADPDLSAAGVERAARLATMLADAGITGIYVTEFKRTQQTAAPLAARLGLTAKPIAAKETATLVSRVRSEQPKGVVLIVGHSNTLPDIIKAFGGRDVKLADDEYSAIYILSPSSGTLTLVRY